MQIFCKLHLVAASRSYTCAQYDLDTVQLALVVFFLPSTSANTCSHGGHRPLQLALVAFFLGALAHLLIFTQMSIHKLPLALCSGGNIINVI